MKHEAADFWSAGSLVTVSLSGEAGAGQVGAPASCPPASPSCRSGRLEDGDVGPGRSSERADCGLRTPAWVVSGHRPAAATGARAGRWRIADVTCHEQ